MALLDEYQVGTDGPWSGRQAAHLSRRAGFGATPAERAALVGGGTQQDLRAAVDAFVDIQADDPLLDAASTGNPAGPGSPLADLPDDDSDLGQVKNPEDAFALVGHWLYRMRYTTQPLQEQLSLFLHDHMVSEANKIQGIIPQAVNAGNDGSLPEEQQCTSGTLAPDPERVQKFATMLMFDQNELFRRTGIDDFRDLLVNVTRNPAMLIYLDNLVNFRGRAQENYARELMELFSMGVGNYSERDIQEIAKALTGETLPFVHCETDYSFEYGFAQQVHEPGTKSVFGSTIQQDFTGAETIAIIDLILDKVSVNPPVSGLAPPFNDLPATAVHMSWKLLSWFVSHDMIRLPAPEDAVLELADYMRGTDNAPYPQRRFPYDFRAVLRKLFLSKLFYDEAHIYSMYKTPADYLVTALKTLGLAELFTSRDGPPVFMLLMGMRLFDPPNVAGWNHGQSWITSGNTVMRYNYAFRLGQLVLSGDYGRGLINALLQQNNGPLLNEFDHEGMIAYVGDRLLQEDFSVEEHDTLLAFLEEMPGRGEELYQRKVRSLIQLVMTMPKYQLK